MIFHPFLLCVLNCQSVLDISDIICIFEGDLMETDPVTFLPKLKVHAFLLHDSLVVASIIQNRYYINLEFCHFIFLLYILDIMFHIHLLRVTDVYMHL